MEKVNINSRVEIVMLENIKKVLETEKEFIIILMEIYMKENKKMIKSNKKSIKYFFLNLKLIINNILILIFFFFYVIRNFNYLFIY